MVRILHVINNLDIGGAEKLVKDLLPRLKAKGLEIELLLLDGKVTNFTEELSKDSNITIHSIGKDINIYNPFLVFKLVPYFKQFDIIHAHLFPCQYWLVLAKIISNSKTILLTTEHSTNNRRRGNWIYKIIDRVIYSKFRLIITVSENAERNLMKHLGKLRSKIRVIENGIDVKAITMAVPYSRDELVPGCEPDTKFVLKVARFFAAKDHSTLIMAMLHLPQNVHLILVGDGELKPHYINMVKEINLVERVHFLGLRQDISRILKSADIIVMSSFYEGLSLSCLEGMASGRPLIASNVQGLRDIVKNTGILFELGDSFGLADAIRALLENDELYKRISINCLKKAYNYDIARTVDSYLKAYESVLEADFAVIQ